MRLSPGARLGPYEIVSLLGSGGMGEVYRARDSRIGRDVALKILHGDVGRFEQEVRAAGALNHPNILAIYDVGTHEGTPYLVSELLEGETLRRRLESGGALKPKAAAEMAREIARGLAAAHQNDIVHRDLKPENIFLTREGRVKILDFGLAKRTTPAAEIGDSTPTAATTPGAILGTVGYMSPEQVRGAAADARSDIFACGLILHEMLSGARTFRRDSAVETLNAILKDDPPELGGETPPPLRRIVARTLEKEPERRFQSAADLAFALESTETASEPAAPTGPATRRRFLAIGSGAAAVAGALVVGTKLARVPHPIFRRLTFRRGNVRGALFAPDGQVIVYCAAWEAGAPRIYTTRLSSPESQALDIPPARLTSISRTGDLAVILQRGNTLARVPLAGGAPREILRNILWADWSPDGQSLLIVRQVASKQRIEFPAGKVLYQTDNLIPEAHLSPDGRQVAFFEQSPSPDDHISVKVVDLNGNHRTLVSGWVYSLGMAWAPNGKEVWFSSSTGSEVPPIRAVDMSGRLRTIFGMTAAAAINDTRPDGRALFSSITWRASMMCQAPSAAAEHDLSWFDYSLASDIAPDGSAVLFSETRQGAAAARQPVTYIRKTDGSAAVALGPGRSCGLSPDGQWAAVLVPGSPRQLVIVPTGAGEQRVLKPERFTYYDARWFADGKRLLVWGNHDERLERHYVQAAAGGALRPITSEGAAMEAAIDPDGEYVAAYAGPGVFLYPVDGSEPERVRGDTAGTRPVAFSASGKSLYLRRENVIELLDLKTGKSEVWKDLMPADGGGVTVIGRFSMTSDASGWVYSYERDQSDLYLGEGLQ
jgi:Tol biopolymer transport system component